MVFFGLGTFFFEASDPVFAEPALSSVSPFVSGELGTGTSELEGAALVSTGDREQKSGFYCSCFKAI